MIKVVKMSADDLYRSLREFAEGTVSEDVFKENNILYPSALDELTDREMIKREADDIEGWYP